jgi:hypothetical protein
MVNKTASVKAAYKPLVNCKIEKPIVDQRGENDQVQAQLGLVDILVNFKCCAEKPESVVRAYFN